MDPFHKPPGDLFKDDSDSDEGHVPSKLDKGKRKAEGVSRPDCVVTATETGGALRALGKGGSCLPLQKIISCTLPGSRCLLFRLGRGLYVWVRF
jgi:hypothetical protein